jgi:large-conductance mechanosensitive channel
MEQTRSFDGVWLAIVLALGFALWQAIDALSSSVVGALVQVFDENDFTFNAHFGLWGVDIEYSRFLGGVMTLVLLSLLFLGYRRRTQRGSQLSG